MLFSIGAHPGFKCPIFKNEKMEDYFLEFEKIEKIDRRKLGKGGLSGERQKFLENEKSTINSRTLLQ